MFEEGFLIMNDEPKQDNFRYRKIRGRAEIGDLVEYRTPRSYSTKNTFTLQLFETKEQHEKFLQHMAFHRTGNPIKPEIGELMIVIERIKLKTGQSFYLVFGTNTGYYFVANSEIQTKV